ncbi:hypothetical protein EYF80_060583 [Liparis tanakae]|uniref:Uncharacterized protein n=1 Tax=Liparis tanakae TaxID=230148 RepID=A0A4Z2EKI5_9TELE|nr:hypothetical protein EYF80_060583 [Liparis tanakae]
MTAMNTKGGFGIGKRLRWIHGGHQQKEGRDTTRKTIPSKVDSSGGLECHGKRCHVSN